MSEMTRPGHVLVLVQVVRAAFEIQPDFEQLERAAVALDSAEAVMRTNPALVVLVGRPEV